MAEAALPDANEFVMVNGVKFTFAEIQNVVEDFYTEIQFDPHLNIPFQSVKNWPEHIVRLTHFWWIRFGGKAYLLGSYNPVAKHFLAGFNDQLLSRWLALFQSTLQQKLSNEQHVLWSSITQRMGQSLSLRNEILRKEHELK